MLENTNLSNIMAINKKQSKQRLIKNKKRYKLKNWSEYNRALKQRGSMELWVNDEVIDQWLAEPSGRPGSQTVYSDFAMEQVRKVDSNRELRGSSGKRPINGVIVPQPSYRTYIYYRPESLCVTISPVFMVPVGAVEALDIKVHRNPGNTHPYSSEEMQTFMSHLKSSITSILSD